MGWTNTRSQIANQKKADPTADVTELRRRLKAERLEEHIRKVVDAAPPLTERQRDRLAAILRAPSGPSQPAEPRDVGGHDAA